MLFLNICKLLMEQSRINTPFNKFSVCVYRIHAIKLRNNYIIK